MREQEVRVDGILCCKILLSSNGECITEFKNGKRIVSIMVEDYLREIRRVCDELSNQE